MKPKLVLHAGAQKTGTTAIQAFAARHRAALARRGVLYPDLTPIGVEHAFPHHRFAHALAGRKGLAPADATRVAGLWAEAAARSGATVLLSAEPLYRYGLRETGGGEDDARAGARGWRTARARYLDRLAAALAPFEVETVLVFRRPDDYVRSLYQENVMRASRPKWPDFAAFRAHALGGALRYAENAGLFAERFARLTCRVYEDLPPGPGFAAAFFAAIGLDAAGLAPVGVVRASLSPAETEAKRVLNAAAFDPGLNGRLVKWLKSPEAAALTARHLGPGPFGLWESGDVRAAFLEAAAPEMERLRAERFPGRATLFPPSREAPLPPAPAFDAAGAAALTELALAAGRGGKTGMKTSMKTSMKTGGKAGGAAEDGADDDD